MSEYRNSPFLSPDTPRLLPPRTHTRTPSRSPTRNRLSVYDDIFADLSPARTYEAFTNPSGRLQASIEAASPADRAFGLRAALASKKIQEWLDELEEWEWPADGGSSGFEIPTVKRRKLSQDVHVSNGDEQQESVYIGSLPGPVVLKYESRIDQIHNEMDDLHVEDIKRQVLDTHFSPRSRPSSSSSNAPPSFLSSYTRMDDFTAIVTATVLKALPSLSKLMRLMDVWVIRLKVLRKVPRILRKLGEAEVAIKSGWEAIRLPGHPETEYQSAPLSREDFRVMQDVLQTQVTKLGQDLDYMLDTLEGREDTLPDAWLDRMEAIEHDYGEWVVAGDRKVREGEWAKIAKIRKEKEDEIRRQAEEAARLKAQKEAQGLEARKREEEASRVLAEKEALLAEMRKREEDAATRKAEKEAQELEFKRREGEAVRALAEKEALDLELKRREEEVLRALIEKEALLAEAKQAEEEAAARKAEKEEQELVSRRAEEEASKVRAEKEILLAEKRKADKQAHDAEMARVESVRRAHEAEMSRLQAEQEAEIARQDAKQAELAREKGLQEAESARRDAERAELTREKASQDEREADALRIQIEQAAAAQLQAERLEAAQLKANQEAQTEENLKLDEQTIPSHRRAEEHETQSLYPESEVYDANKASILASTATEIEEPLRLIEQSAPDQHPTLISGQKTEPDVKETPMEARHNSLESSVESSQVALNLSHNKTRDLNRSSSIEMTEKDRADIQLPSTTFQEAVSIEPSLQTTSKLTTEEEFQPSHYAQIRDQEWKSPASELLLTPAALAPPDINEGVIPQLHQKAHTGISTRSINGLVGVISAHESPAIACDHQDHIMIPEALAYGPDADRAPLPFDGIDDSSARSYEFPSERTDIAASSDFLGTVPESDEDNFQESLNVKPSNHATSSVLTSSPIEGDDSYWQFVEDKIPDIVPATSHFHSPSPANQQSLTQLSPPSELTRPADITVQESLVESNAFSVPDFHISTDSPTSSPSPPENAQVDYTESTSYNTHQSISSIHSLSDPIPEVLEEEPAHYFRPVVTPVNASRLPSSPGEPSLPRSAGTSSQKMALGTGSPEIMVSESPLTSTKSVGRSPVLGGTEAASSFEPAVDQGSETFSEIISKEIDPEHRITGRNSDVESMPEPSHIDSFGDGAMESIPRDPPIELPMRAHVLARKISITRINSLPKRISIPRRGSNSSSTSTVIRSPVGDFFLNSPVLPSTPDYSEESFRDAEDASPSIRRHRNDNSHDHSSPDSPPPIPNPSNRNPITYPRKSSFSSTAPSEASASSPDTPLFGNIDVTTAPFSSPKKHSTDDQLQQQISSLLESIPARIKLTSEPDTDRKERILVKKSRPSLGAAFRSSSSMSNYSRAPTPSFTLAPAYGKGQSRQRPQSNNPEIKLYHLSRSTGEAPIKLFVRLVGENGERVMVRVGGGWADLGEYLKEYASHHGRRTGAAVDNSKVEVQDMTPRIVSSSSSTSTSTIRAPGRSSPVSRPGSAFDRPMSSLNIRKTRQSTGTDLDVPRRRDNFRSPSTPVPSVIHNRTRNFNTPPSAASSLVSASSERGAYDRSSSRLSWTEEDSSLGLAGPKSKKIAISERDQEWVESMKEKVRQASAEKERTKQRGTSFGEMDKIGGTKRLFRKS